MKFTNKIKFYRLQRMMTQYDLAVIAGVSRSFISEVESGRHIPCVDIAIRLSRAVMKPTDSVFFFKA